MLLGKIIHSNDHLDYLCQVYRGEEVEQPPSPDDYAMGRFVSIDLPDERQLIGVIYNTQLFNPDFGRLGPRLSPESELEIFSPDYLEERAVLIAIAALGTLGPDEATNQNTPELTPNPDALVHRLDDEAIRQFHMSEGRLQMAYAPLLLSRRSSMIRELMLVVINQLGTLLPDQQQLLSLLRDDLLWRARVAPLGGEG